MAGEYVLYGSAVCCGSGGTVRGLRACVSALGKSALVSRRGGRIAFQFHAVLRGAALGRCRSRRGATDFRDALAHFLVWSDGGVPDAVCRKLPACFMGRARGRADCRMRGLGAWCQGCRGPRSDPDPGALGVVRCVRVCAAAGRGSLPGMRCSSGRSASFGPHDRETGGTTRTLARICRTGARCAACSVPLDDCMVAYRAARPIAASLSTRPRHNSS